MSEQQSDDPRLIKRVDLPGGHWADVRVDAVGRMLGAEAEDLLRTYTASDSHVDYVRREVELCIPSVRRANRGSLPGRLVHGMASTHG